MLTRKQHELLMLIHERMSRDGVPPSFDEMKDALSLRSKSGIHRLITALEERGFIRRLPHRARAIEILRMPGPVAERPVRRPAALSSIDGGLQSARDSGAREIPLIGRIAAGLPIEALQHAGDTLQAPASILSDGAEHFALEVAGDSMIEAGILDGDHVLIRRQNSADNGDIVVALIEKQEATLKRLRRQPDGRIALEAANPAYETRIYRAHDVDVQGRLVGLMRRY